MKLSSNSTTMAGETYVLLRARILDGDIPPAARVRTTQLSAQLAISLGAVREALSQLSSEGLVVYEAHRGYTVSPISIVDLRDLTRLRIEIERICLAWSIENGTLDWESQVITSSHRLAKTYRPHKQIAQSAEWTMAHDAFHEALVRACGSSRLLQFRRQLYDQSERYRKLESAWPKTRDPDAEHKRIADAALRRDIPLATRLIQEHISATAENITRAMSKRVSQTAGRLGKASSAKRYELRKLGPLRELMEAVD
jgi:GntR family transcriptional regulator, carbon starvation induced regulator